MKSIISLIVIFISIATPRWGLANDYNIEEISVEPIAQQITRTGKLAFKRTLTLSFKNSGYLTKLLVDEGDYFEQGQLLASMNTVELTANKNAAYSRLMQAKREVNRTSHLIEKN